MSKPGKVLKGLCKKMGVRLTIKRGQKRVYKSVAVLKKQCANKKKVKKKKVKRRRRRKFGMPPGLLMTQKKIDNLHKESLIPDQIQDYRDSQAKKYARIREIPHLPEEAFQEARQEERQSLEDRIEEARIEEARREEAHQARIERLARQTRQEEARQARQTHQARIERLARLVEVQSNRERLATLQEAERQQRASDLVSDSNASFDWNVHGPYLGLGLGLAGAGGVGYLTHKFIKKQRKKRKKLTRFGKKKKRKVKRKRKKIKKKSKK